jgi:peptidoglycan hydrolase-like protein with peptidoglycan-binding domain
MLHRGGWYDGAMSGTMNAATRAAVRAFRTDHGMSAVQVIGGRAWTALLSQGDRRLLKYGAAGERVRRLQRTLNAASGSERLAVTGIFESETTAAVKRYRSRLRLPVTGVVTPALWRYLQAGRG